MSADRRDFLQKLAVGGFTLGSLPSVLNAASSPQSQSQAYDVSWTKKLTGKHKAVYDCPDIEAGYGIIRAGIVPTQYAEVFGTKPSEFSTVIVLRHTGIHLAMNKAYWAAYGIGKKFNAKHPVSEQPTDLNPGLLTEPDGVPAMIASFAIDKQIARGITVLGCALAFGDVVGLIAGADNISAAEAERKAKSMLIPGVVMQPSGVFATTLAQENGCAYVRAT